MAVRSDDEKQVWDPFVRIAHWTVAVAFVVAYLTEDEAMTVHVWAGYLIGALVLLRVAWGFVGSRYARFSDFTYAPRKVIGYLGDLVRLRAPRYLGHSPAGGAMVIALLLCLAAAVTTGLFVYAEERGAGPLAPLYPQISSSSVPAAEIGESFEENGDERESKFKDIHELFANITLALAILHVLGVVLASFAHRENLARAMVTGRKRIS